MSAKNSDVCHAWAHGEERAFYGSHLSHSDGVLKSYNEIIGERLEIKNNVVFILNNAHYSNTTDCHQRLMCMAVPKNDSHVFELNKYFIVKRDAFGYLRRTNMKKYMQVIGLCMLMTDLYLCRDIKTTCSPSHDFGFRGYKEMLRLFDVTRATTVKSLLRMKISDFRELVWYACFDRYGTSYIEQTTQQLRKLLSILSKDEETDIATIVDEINGKGCWQQYMKRTSGQRDKAKRKRLSNFVRYANNNIRFYGFDSYVGRCKVCAKGSITKAEYDKHVKKGDLISWLLSVKKKNIDEAIKETEKYRKLEIRHRAMHKLEYKTGMIGFTSYYIAPRKRFVCFNYDGVIFDFRDSYSYTERHLTQEEYDDFVACDNKMEWIRNKKRWMLEQLQREKQEYEESKRKWTEEMRLREEERLFRNKLTEGREEYIKTLKASGSEGLRQLYHEGYSVSLPYEDSPVYYGGNVLLRVNHIRKMVETSKQIMLSFDECKRLWAIFQRWHNKTEKYQKGMDIETQHTTYKVHSFQNDILTAGCHRIAYKEMLFVAKELGLE